jgi:hypothetical protein
MTVELTSRGAAVEPATAHHSFPNLTGFALWSVPSSSMPRKTHVSCPGVFLPHWNLPRWLRNGFDLISVQPQHRLLI